MTTVKRIARATETRLRIEDVANRIQELAEESRAANKRLEERIASLVAAIGQFLAGGKQQ